MTSRFESSAVDVRMAAPFVDGAREVRCPKKMDQVIAGQRCLDAQDEGCSCPRAVDRLVKLELDKAKKPAESQPRLVLAADKVVRNARILEQHLADDSFSSMVAIAAKEHVSLRTVRAVINGEAPTTLDSVRRKDIKCGDKFGTLRVIAIVSAKVADLPHQGRCAQVECLCGWKGYKPTRHLLREQVKSCAGRRRPRCVEALRYFKERSKSTPASRAKAMGVIAKAQALEST